MSEEKAESNVVLFGAGASKGLQNILPESPPLGFELFSKLQEMFPNSWGNLPTDIENQFNENFELGMGEIWENHSEGVPSLMREMALYFLQFKPENIQNLYQEFISNLSEKNFDFILSSLNYELLLEFAVNSNQLQINYFGNSKNNSVGVWKLHGSANFIPKNIQATSGVSYTRGVHFEAGFDTANPKEAIEFCNSNTALYPSMCLFMNSKPTQISFNLIRNQQKRWADLVLKAPKILIIGVRPYMEDIHIWDSLTKTEGKVGFVGSKEGCLEWFNSGREERNTVFIGERWNEVFEDSLSFFD